MIFYHFVSKSGYEDYANENELHGLLDVYIEHHCPFTVDKIEDDEDEDDEDDEDFTDY